MNALPVNMRIDVVDVHINVDIDAEVDDHVDGDGDVDDDVDGNSDVDADVDIDNLDGVLSDLI